MEPFRLKMTHAQIDAFVSVLKTKIYTKVSELEAVFAVTPEPVPYGMRKTLEYSPIKLGEVWGRKVWDCAWFHITGKVPSKIPTEELCLAFDFEGEACLFDDTGTPIRGLTNVSSEFSRVHGLPGKRYVPFTDGTFDTSGIDVWIETGCNDLFGVYRGGILRECAIVRCNEKLRSLFYDFRILMSLAEGVPPGDPQHMSVFYALEKAFLCFSSAFTDAEADKAAAILSKELSRKNSKDSLLTFYGVGHSHMDLAWLWPIRETRRKVGRTFATAVANIKDYDGYIYGASQPQQFVWLKNDYPGLYAKVKQLVSKGRIEPQGAMWVEADTNISGGEALIRQMIYGKKFFKEEFDKDINILWLPDVFGFSGALPQIMKKCGVDYFLTIKLSWSIINKFPYHTFVWQGIDGSEVIVHMPPEGNYNSSGTPRIMLAAQSNYAERGLIDKAMLLYGIGDGGGGPGREHLEIIERTKDLMGTPKIKNAPSTEFFEGIKKDKGKLNVWRGEMYLERHQGTYTTQGKNKYFNRLMENTLQSLEKAYVILNADYPKKRLEEIWKEVLLYQFHDILPGSSIKRVYDESTERYAALYNETGAMFDSLGDGGLSMFNPNSFILSDYVKHDGLWYKADVPALSFARPVPAEGVFEVAVTDTMLENKYLKAVFDKDGSLKSLIDKPTGRETVAGKSNVHCVYNDFGDAWDMYVNYDAAGAMTFALEKMESYIDGPKACIRQTYTFGNSVLRQTVSVKADSPLLEFENELDWKEDAKMCRTEFYANIFTDKVTCDIQFGNIERTTGENTSRDYAMSEICAHKWLDLSESDYGLALLNDCKYGYRVKGGRISMNIARSTQYPGIDADKCIHKYRYALYPHKETANNSDVVRLGYAFNNGLKAIGKNLETAPFAETDKANIIIDAVKKSEDGKSVVLRIFESNKKNTDTVLTLSGNYKVFEADMLENREKEIKKTADGYILKFKPFEIKTIILD